MIEVSIPGGHANIREVSEVSVRHRNMVRASFMVTARLYASIPQDLIDASGKEGKKGLEARQKIDLIMLMSGMTQEEAEALLAQQSAAIVAFVADWDLKDANGQKRPLPTMETILDIPPDLYDALAEVVAGPAARMLRGTVNMDPVPREVDPDAPFGESKTSSGRSKTPTGKKRTSTGKQPSDTESTDTESSSD